MDFSSTLPPGPPMHHHLQHQHNLRGRQAAAAVVSTNISPPLSPPSPSDELEDAVHGVPDDDAIDTDAGPQQYVCHWIACDRVYDDVTQLGRHIQTIHIARDKKNGRCMWINCPREQKPFSTKMKLIMHLRGHTGEKPYQCNFQGCVKRFSRMDILSKHMKSHINATPHPCAVPGCGMRFSTDAHLQQHIAHQHSYARSAADPTTMAMMGMTMTAPAANIDFQLPHPHPLHHSLQATNSKVYAPTSLRQHQQQLQHEQQQHQQHLHHHLEQQQFDPSSVEPKRMRVSLSENDLGRWRTATTVTIPTFANEQQHQQQQQQQFQQRYPLPPLASLSRAAAEAESAPGRPTVRRSSGAAQQLFNGHMTMAPIPFVGQPQPQQPQPQQQPLQQQPLQPALQQARQPQGWPTWSAPLSFDPFSSIAADTMDHIQPQQQSQSWSLSGFGYGAPLNTSTSPTVGSSLRTSRPFFSLPDSLDTLANAYPTPTIPTSASLRQPAQQPLQQQQQRQPQIPAIVTPSTAATATDANTQSDAVELLSFFVKSASESATASNGVTPPPASATPSLITTTMGNPMPAMVTPPMSAKSDKDPHGLITEADDDPDMTDSEDEREYTTAVLPSHPHPHRPLHHPRHHPYNKPATAIGSGSVGITEASVLVSPRSSSPCSPHSPRTEPYSLVRLS